LQAITSEAVHAPYPARGVAWYATIMLAFLYWLSILDRFIISLLVDPIKRDLGLTDVQLGLLQGFAFAITFAVFGLLFGTLADRVSRRWVIFTGVSIWSMATAACGVAQNFWHLMLARIGVGAGEAALNPCATSMLADLFPRERLTSAMAVYAMGSTVGMGTAFVFGGAIVQLVSGSETMMLPLIGEVRSWQAVFFIVGIPGMLLSLLIFTVPEPFRRGRRIAATDTPRSSPYRELLRFMSSRKRFFLCHYAGFILASMIISGMGSWYAAHMARKFGWGAGQIGLSLGVTIAAAGVIGKFLCGRIVDAMYQRGSRDAQMRWYAGCLLFATPIGIWATTSGNPWVYLIGIGTYLIFTSPLPACSSTSLNLVTPNELRGTGMAFYGAVGGILGAGLGPLLMAAAAQYIYGSESAIGLGMATVIGVCGPLGALCLWLGFRAMREAVTEAETWERH
jgi:MFS family permease